MKCNKTKSGALIFLLTFSGLFSAVIGLIDFNSINDPFEEKLEENPIDLRISDHNWTKLFLISENSTRDGQYPNIAMDGAGNIHIVWQDDSLEYDGTTYEDIIYRMWNATSGIWSASTLISTISTSYCYSPAIAVDNDNNIHVVWEDVTNILGAGTYYDIFYKYWNATTKVWSGHTGVYDLVTSNSSHVYDCENPDIAVDNDGNVHVVWWDENEGFGDGPGYDIFYKCWNRTTGVWGSVEVVSLEATGNGYGPSMAVDPSGNVHVVWYDYTDLHGAGTDGDIFYRFKNSTTGIWYGQINNTDVLKTSGNSYYPAIVADDQGNIHIVWYDSDSTFGAGTDYDIFYRYWNVTTQAWSGPNPFVISDYAASQSSYYPEIATDNASNIYVVWQQYGNQHGTDFNDDIVLRVWNASSGTWSVKELVSAILSFDSYWPEVAVDPTGAICVAWWEYIVAGDDDIFFKKTITTPPPPTTLDPILPNPTANLEIDLNWHETLSTHQYYLYRDTSFISSVAGLTPIAVLADPVTSYMDTVTQNGTYYYAVVAGNHIGNSSVSNCENVTVFSLKQNRRMRIANNADFPTYATSGNGSAANPWVIENYYIDGVRRTCINITDTTDYFILRNNTVYGGDNGILLNNVINGEIRNNTARFCSIGFHLLNSQDNRVINNTAYNNTGTETYSGIGFFLDNSDSNWLDGNWAFDNWGIAGLSYSGLGILLWSADSNNLTNNHVFHNYHYNTTYQYPQYGGIGILGMSSPAYNRFIKNVIFENRGYNNYHSMGVFFQGGGQGNVLEENTIYNQLLEGVYFRSSGTNNEFINNTIFDCQVGVRTIGTSSPIIMYNKLFNLADGLYLWGGSATVHKNEIWNNTGRGIYFVAAGNDIATNNTIYNNSVGIQTGNSNNIRLYNNTIFDNNNGISLGNMPNGVLIDNFVYNNTNYGITLYDNFTQITRNTISGHDVGIYVGSAGSFSVYSDITLNTITDNRVGIHLLRNKYTSLDNNEIYNNSEDGIFLESTNHSTVTSNIIMHSSDGIHLLYNVNTTVQFNEIYNCSLGIRIENTSLSNISWNLLFNNTQTLLELFGINNTIGINPSMYGPVLNPIVPNIVDDGWVHLQWQSLPWATYYQVFRDIVTIDEFWDIVGKTPVVNVTSNDGWDTQFASPGLYCYVVVAANTTEWSTISNYEWVNVTGIYGVPGTPILNPISPNPDYNGIIELDWNDVQNATKYYVYRDVSTIANISGLSPIAVVTDSNFTDTLILDGTFYYVILGGNPEHNGTISNCENVTVMISPIPETPNLDPITPSLDFDGIIQLDWTDAGNATVYFIYRDVVPILTLTGLTPIASTIQSNFTDTNFVDGVYYYAIVSGNLGWNSSPSNSENVTIWKQYPVGITLLNPISPSPDIDGIIQLDWDPAENATRYYVYKDTALILSVASLNPIATVTATNFTDYAPINGTFFYAIVGGNPLFNGTLSNSEWVTVAIPARTTTGWTIPIILSPDSKNSSTSPTMAMDAAGNLFVVWSDNSTLYGSGGDADIFCRIWNASSQTWGSINVVSNESDSDSTAPAIAIDALGNLHVAWVDLSDWNGAGTDGDIFYKIYNTSTEAWSQTVVVTTESATASNGPAIGVNNLGNIYIVWCESNASETNIYEMFWNATSSSWSGNTTVSSEIVGDSRNPQIGVDENYNVHIVWEASSSSLSSGADDDIFYRMWNETGQSWSGTELVSLQSLLDSNSPSTVVEADGTVHLAWHDLTPYAGSGGDYDIFYKYRNVGTGLWSGNVNSTDVVSYGSDGPSIYPFITLDTDSELHIVWSDYSDVFGAGTDADIFYKFWNSSSLTWQGYINYSDVVTVESSEDAFSASVAVTKNQQGTIAIQVHVVWQDATDFGFGADWDVYYKSFLDIYPIPTTPYLYPITPAIDYDGEIFLDWTASNNATKYFVYRDVSNITDVSFLVPIAILATKINYTDTVSVDGTYYYVVVAGNQRFNSSLSNCENVTFVRYYPVTTPTLDPIVPNPDYDGLIALNWSSAENATIYYVYVDVSVITNVSALTPIKTTIDTNEEVQLTDGTYYFVVVAGNLGFNGSLSNCVNVTVNIQYPVTTPILLPITPNPSYDGLINLDWSDATNATVYYIYRHFTNITNITGLVPIANANQSNYLDITNDNTTWYYVIVAGNLAYNSSISNCENVTVTIVPIPETPILNFIFPSTNYYGNVSLDWTDTANTTHYYVYRDLYPLSNITGLTPIATVWDSNYTDYNFIDGTYSYFIVSANLGRNGSTSNIQNVTIEMYYPISTPNLSPIVPSVDYDGIIDLDWDDAPNATQYNVYRDSLPLDVVTQSNYTDMIFTNGTYTYTIMAGNPGYNSSLSNAENVTVNKYWPVGTPILEAIAPQLDYDGIIYLNWSTAENASQYYLYRDTVPINTVTGLTPHAVVVAQTNYTDVEFTDGTYYYVVIAGNLGYNSTISNSRNVTVLKQYPVGFSLIDPISPRTDTDGVVHLTWLPA
ncbi:MAG: right-handed parallel beta-helix repeat-containing protein, partial [Candidatus Helarchaeota archaeon]|nr:right-handed parallel beta-helix repeat-containing protein [Candidatus Helarchaeota archaeon]